MDGQTETDDGKPPLHACVAIRSMFAQSDCFFVAASSASLPLPFGFGGNSRGGFHGICFR